MTRRRLGCIHKYVTRVTESCQQRHSSKYDEEKEEEELVQLLRRIKPILLKDALHIHNSINNVMMN